MTLRRWLVWRALSSNRLNPPGPSPCLQTGFSLLEIIVAVAILAVLSLIVFQGLSTLLNSQQHYQQAMARLQSVQWLFLWLGRDIEQAIDRDIRAAYGDRLPALQGYNNSTYWLELTRTSWHNLQQQPRSELQRIAYEWRDGQIIRHAWSVLDRAQDSAPNSAVLLSQVTQLQVRFLENITENRWQTAWPVFSSAVTTPASPLPQAIEVILTLEEWGEIRRLFALVQSPQRH